MFRQYFAHRFQGRDNPLRIGVIGVGSIYYLQDEGFFRDRHDAEAVCRDPWIVEGFLNGQQHAARRDPATGRWLSLYLSRRSDMAVVRSLRDGCRRRVAVRILELHDDLGLWKQPTGYPPSPCDRFDRSSEQRQRYPIRHAA